MTISSKVHALARLVTLIALLAVLLPGLAAAQSLDDLRTQGTVGERYDGLAVVRTAGAPAAVAEFIAGINAQRQKIYAERAAQQKVPVEQVAKIYAMEIYAKLPKGAWFLDESNSWRQK